jgi:tetratricopeptide (TPR) repeat protein
MTPTDVQIARVKLAVREQVDVVVGPPRPEPTQIGEELNLHHDVLVERGYRVRVRWIVAPVVFLGVLTTAAAVLPLTGLPRWLSAPLAAAVTLVLDQLVKPWLERRRQAGQTDAAAVEELRRHLARQDRLPRFDAVDPVAQLHVHRAIPLTGPAPSPSARPVRATKGAVVTAGGPRGREEQDPDLPRWVERDQAPEVRAWLRQTASTGGFLLLIGESSVGKTRFAYDCVAEVLPNWAVLMPDLGDGDLVNHLAEATFTLPRLVVWLDELQRYLPGPYLSAGSSAVTAGAVRRLLTADSPVLIVGTLWPEHVRTLRSTDIDPATGQTRLRYPGAADVLDDRRCHEITLRSMNRDERSRAVAVIDSDPRLAVAVAEQDFGVTETLAGAPQLVSRYEQADPSVRAVLDTAVDLRRLGVQAPLLRQLLCEGARGYLQAAEPDDRWFPPALAEATRVEGATAPLLPIYNEEHRTVHGYTVAGYLLQYGAKRRRLVVPPSPLWNACGEHVTDPADLYRLAESAQRRGLLGHAEALLRRTLAADPSASLATTMLADMLEEQGRLAEAEEVLRAALVIEPSFAPARLPELLQKQGRLAEAEQLLRAQGATGRRDLAVVLSKQGREKEAEQLLREEAPDPFSERQLAWLLHRQGRHAEAEQLLRESMLAAEFAGDLGQMLWEQGRQEEAEQLLRNAVATGLVFGLARKTLVNLLREQGRDEEAEQLLRDPAAAHDGLFAVLYGTEQLADLLQKQGRLAEAEQLLRDAVAGGDHALRGRLADVLWSRGRQEEAEDLLQAAVAAGEPYATKQLAELRERAICDRDAYRPDGR